MPAPVQAIKHMGFGGPEKLRGLTEGKLTEGKQLTSKIPCMQKKASKRTKHIEATVSRENDLGGVHGLGVVWIGKPRPSLVGTLLSWFPAVATNPSVLSRFSGLIVCDLVHSLGNGIHPGLPEDILLLCEFSCLCVPWRLT